MPNYLTGVPSITSQKVITATAGAGASASAYQVGNALQALSNGGIQGTAVNLGASAAIAVLGGTPAANAIGGALNNIGLGALGSIFGVGGLSGTKPTALHTERAGSKAEGDKPYREGKDIEFFLLRADQTAPESPGEGDGPAAASPATAQTGGGDFLGKALQSPLGQLATGVAVNAAVGAASSKLGRSNQSLAGPLTGLAFTAGIGAVTGKFSQNAASAAGGSQSSVSNAVQTGSDVVSANQTIATNSLTYSANSQSYFSNLSTSSFSGSAAQFSTTTDPTINSAFSGGASSALATDLGSSYNIASNSELASALGPNGEVPSYADGVVSNLFGPTLNEDALSIQFTDTAETIPKSWYFITAPQDVNWSKEGKVATVDTYGTNTPYVAYGSTSLRKLTLGSVLLEGFSDRKTVEANIVALETCMNMVINAEVGYTSPYCWKVYVGGKNYGTFIITGVKVKEVMRDLRGYATRAVVDIDLQQVPEYQVNSGRDLASKATVGAVKANVEAALGDKQDNAVSKSKTAGTGGNASAGGGAGGGSGGGGGGSGGGGGGGLTAADPSQRIRS